MPQQIDLTILNHHKCASNWMRQICRQLERRGLITYDVIGGRKQPDGVQPTPDAKHVVLDVNALHDPTQAEHFEAARIVHFVRDPRDAFVSTYWSWLKSHKDNGETILAFRETASGLSVEDGMIQLIADFPMGRQLQTWSDAIFASVRQVRYEDLLADFGSTLISLYGHGGISIPPRALSRIGAATDFTTITGRARGEEDVAHHFRKGVAGDWRNYFTDRVEKLFYAEYGWLGPKLGYW